MTKKLTPAEAWEHVKALIPSANCMYVCDGVVHVREIGGHEKRFEQLKINWPEGVTQWPPKEPEKKWREARMPEDWGKPARFKDSGESDEDWEEELLSGYSVKSGLWFDQSGMYWDQCQVEEIPEQVETPTLDPIKDVVYPEQDLQNVGTSQQHPADREPTDEEVERACQLRYGRAWQEMWGIEQAHKEHESKLWLKAWQQVWREQK